MHRAARRAVAATAVIVMMVCVLATESSAERAPPIKPIVDAAVGTDAGVSSDAATTDAATADASTATCAVAGQLCSPGSSCCSGLCAVDAGGAGMRCQLLSGCAPSDEVCTRDPGCCSGKCGAPDANGLRRCVRTSTCHAAGELFGNGNCCVTHKLGRTSTRSGIDRCSDRATCIAAQDRCAFDEQCCNGGHCLLAGDGTGFRCSM